jgi:hypothetical protein
MDPEPMWLRTELRVTCLLYADAIVLFSRKAEILRRLLRACDSHSVSRNYVFGPSKCVIIELIPPEEQKAQQRALCKSLLFYPTSTTCFNANFVLLPINPSSPLVQMRILVEYFGYIVYIIIFKILMCPYTGVGNRKVQLRKRLDMRRLPKQSKDEQYLRPTSASALKNYSPVRSP